MKRINIGCGFSPIPGWYNYDNFIGISFAKIPFLSELLIKSGLVGLDGKRYYTLAQRGDVQYADATKHIPLPDNCADVVYSSHMVEHLSQEDALKFLTEAYRILVPGGIIRIVVPDLSLLVKHYLQHGDADVFMQKSMLSKNSPRTLIQRLKYFVIGDMHHQWMYDGRSMARLLLRAGFRSPRILEPGTTTIPAPGELNLREREYGSVFVEAWK